MQTQERMNIAVVGGGVAGIVAAHLLSRRHNVSIFESADYLGGHTSTVTLDSGPDEGTAVDTGFIVLNDQTYPLLHSFLRELEVPVRWSCMSFGYHNEVSKFEYAGTNLNGMFADRSNAVRPAFYNFLREVYRFATVSNKALRNGSLNGSSVEQYVRNHNFSQQLVDDFLVPMAGAIWSAPQKSVLSFSAEMLLRFFDNHGLLKVFNRPRWQTVVGGSHSYVKAFRQKFPGKVSLSTPIESIKRSKDAVVIRAKSGELASFDYAVVALHADSALRVLSDPSPQEQRLLGGWRYENNHTVLHWDEAMLPQNRRVWASWNYVREKTENSDTPVRVTYHMNRLQGLNCSREYCVTLNRTDRIDPSKVVREFNYSHPSFSVESLKTQRELPALNGVNRTYFCGSYFGYGFHEDAVRAGAEVGRRFGVSL